jgi:hypothetical protein
MKCFSTRWRLDIDWHRSGEAPRVKRVSSTFDVFGTGSPTSQQSHWVLLFNTASASIVRYLCYSPFVHCIPISSLRFRVSNIDVSLIRLTISKIPVSDCKALVGNPRGRGAEMDILRRVDEGEEEGREDYELLGWGMCGDCVAYGDLVLIAYVGR